MSLKVVNGSVLQQPCPKVRLADIPIGDCYRRVGGDCTYIRLQGGSLQITTTAPKHADRIRLLAFPRVWSDENVSVGIGEDQKVIHLPHVSVEIAFSGVELR